MAQGAVVDVQDARPGDRPLIDAQSIAVVEVVVDEGPPAGCGRRDGVEISRQVQIHALGGTMRAPPEPPAPPLIPNVGPMADWRRVSTGRRLRRARP